MKIKSTVFILLAGIFWGSMGLFVHLITDKFGISPVESSCMRIITCTFILFVFLLIYDKKLLKITPRDIPLLASCGIFSVVLMSGLYFASIGSGTSMSIAAVLMYTAPFIVMLLSCIFLGEKISLQKIIALVIAFVGCLLVSLTEKTQSTPLGIILALLSGIAYALYSIFGVVGLKKHHVFTFTFYSFLFASAGSVFIGIFTGLTSKITSLENIPIFLAVSFAMGLVTAVLPFTLYTIGLSGTSPSKASIMAYAEPMSACVFGLILGEKMTPLMILGLAFTLISIIFLNINIPFLSGKKETKADD